MPGLLVVSPDVADILAKSENDLHEVLEALQKLCENSLSRLDEEGRVKPKRIQWARNRRKVVQHFERAKAIRCNLQFAMHSVSLRFQQ